LFPAYVLHRHAIISITFHQRRFQDIVRHVNFLPSNHTLTLSGKNMNKYLAIALLLVNCTSSTMPTEPVSPVGEYYYSEPLAIGGIATVTYFLTSDNVFYAEGSLSDGTTSILYHTEKGTWKQSENTIVFNPSSCKDYNTDTESLIPAICGEPYSFTLSNNTLSDGTLILTKK